MSVESNRERWLSSPRVSAEDKATIKAMDKATSDDAFFKDAEFGTGGMRGRLGPGTNRLNEHTVGRVAVALAEYYLSLNQNAEERGIVISHDNRFFSREFTLLSAKIFNEMGINAYIFDALRPTPELSYAVRYMHAIGGVMVTASHNPKDYNGYKVYDETGCQMIPSMVDDMLKIANKLPNELEFEVPQAKVKGVTKVLGPEVDDSYCKLVEACRRNPDLDKTGFKVVYSPQHGASYESAMRVFKDCGYNIIPVKEQCVHDPAFGATKSPNPEIASAWEKVIELMEKEHADLGVMTDPDGDRCGLAFRNKDGGISRLTGNQSGAMLIDYLFSDMTKKGDMPANPVMYDTIVTSGFGRAVAKHYGVAVESFLTGFKFIGDRIGHYEKLGKGPTFVFGYEESYGCLIKPFVRDKDGVQAILLYTEMALSYHNQGITLDVAYENLQKKYGYFYATMADTYFEGMSGAEKMAAMMAKLHKEPLKEIGGLKVVKTGDYLNDVMIYADGSKEAIENLPPSDVLKYFLEDGSTVTVRPSGTEPKVKYYVEAVGKENAGLADKASALIKAIDKIANA